MTYVVVHFFLPNDSNSHGCCWQVLAKSEEEIAKAVRCVKQDEPESIIVSVTFMEDE